MLNLCGDTINSSKIAFALVHEDKETSFDRSDYHRFRKIKIFNVQL